MIKVKDLVKKYGNHVAVDHLSFEVQKGQIYGFLGPNGAGKSTTMNIMTGYLAATSGTVEIHGYDILTQPEQAKQYIGYLPEIPPLYPDMTVLEYLRFVAELKKVPKNERKEQIQEIMQMVEILDVENRLIKNLSKGYKQRVGLAQAMIGFPDVIILDEPMVGLDPKQIIEIRALIKKLAENHTIILSSHILSEVSTICDYVMIISHGKLVASDSPEGLQKLMEKTIEIEVVALGSQEKAEEILSKLEHIQTYGFEEPTEENSVKIKVVTEENIDIRKELSIALTNGDMPVLSMHRVEKSLEDIFLQLTETPVQATESCQDEEKDADEVDGEDKEENADAGHEADKEQEAVEEEIEKKEGEQDDSNL